MVLLFSKKVELNRETKSEEYPLPSKKLDELDRYLDVELEKVKLKSNPMNFWRDHREKFPRLSCLARWIFSVPATSTNVERQLSGAGLVKQERRTNLNPGQLDNILPIRSMEKYEHFFRIMVVFFFSYSNVFYKYRLCYWQNSHGYN